MALLHRQSDAIADEEVTEQFNSLFLHQRKQRKEIDDLNKEIESLKGDAVTRIENAKQIWERKEKQIQQDREQIDSLRESEINLKEEKEQLIEKEKVALIEIESMKGIAKRKEKQLHTWK
jgi:6-pyruvoyl-tetrahydropterin synthase